MSGPRPASSPKVLADVLAVLPVVTASRPPRGRPPSETSHGSKLSSYDLTSALVKAFLDELGRDELLEILAGATAVATARLAYVETRAAFARAAREGRLSASDARSASRAFDQRWSQLAIVELDDSLAREAAALADMHPLRAADAVHLASALSIAFDDPNAVAFACWDARLWDEARKTGFVMGPAARPGNSPSPSL